MKQSLFTVFSNRLLTPDARQPVCEMVLEGDLTPAPGAVNRPGQFVNVRLDGCSCAARSRSVTWTRRQDA